MGKRNKSDDDKVIHVVFGPGGGRVNATPHGTGSAEGDESADRAGGDEVKGTDEAYGADRHPALFMQSPSRAEARVPLAAIHTDNPACCAKASKIEALIQQADGGDRPKEKGLSPSQS